MFILDTDHISLFQRRDPHVTARVLATSALELATTVITVEEQSVRLDRVRRARSVPGGQSLSAFARHFPLFSYHHDYGV
jgi:hypothetical protein